MRRSAQRTNPLRGGAVRTGDAGGTRLICIDLRRTRDPDITAETRFRFPADHPPQGLLVDIAAGDADSDRFAGQGLPQGKQAGEARCARSLRQVVRRAQEQPHGVRDGGLADLDEAGETFAQGREGELVHRAVATPSANVFAV